VSAAEGDFDTLVDLIYQGALEEQPWQGALPALRTVLDAQVVSLVLRPPSDDDRGVILNCVRPDPLDPFVNLPLNRVVALEDILPDRELMASDYYLHYLQPIDLFRILGVDTIEPGGMLARLRISRRRSEKRFGKTERSLLERITPHLRRAIQIYAKLNRTTSERDIYAGAVDQLSVATIILDEQGRLLNTNALAKALLEEGDGLSLKGQHLIIDGRDINRELQQALTVIIRAQQVKALRVPRSAGRADLGLVIRPVPASERSEGQASPCAAVFISDPG
jgi:PAS domain-containing protein